MSDPEFTVLYDGDCPLCSREMAMLNRIDRGRGRLGAIDIAADGFDPARYGRDLDALMGRIHGVCPDGTVIEGVEVFRRAYAAVRRGGMAVIVGVGPITENVPINSLMLSMEGKTLKGSYYGDANIHHDFRMLLDLYTAGKLNLDDMVTATYSIDEAPQAFDDMEAGKNARGVILYD